MSIVDNIRTAYDKRCETIEVECPEWPDEDGNPSTIRFRTALSVADYLEINEAKVPTAVAYLVMLFIVLAMDESGKRLVTPEMAADGNGWLFKATSGLDLVSIVKRANLAQIVADRNEPQLPEVDHEGKTP